jgi:hypothetical protein
MGIILAFLSYIRHSEYVAKYIIVRTVRPADNSQNV